MFWFVVMQFIQQSLKKRGETSIPIIISMVVNLVCEFLFGILYYRDVEKLTVAKGIIILTILYTLLLILTITLCINQNKDYVVLTETYDSLFGENIDYSITSQEKPGQASQKQAEDQSLANGRINASSVRYNETTYQFDDLDQMSEVVQDSSILINSEYIRQQQQRQGQEKATTKPFRQSLME